MFENHFGLIEAAFVFGLAVAFYIWQMRDLAKADREARDPGPATGGDILDRDSSKDAASDNGSDNGD